MGTVVIYVVLTLVVAAALFGLSVVVFGRGELLPAVHKGGTLARLPEGEIAGADLRALTFQMTARGYSMTEVDWALEQAAAEIDRLSAELGQDKSKNGRNSASKVSR